MNTVYDIEDLNAERWIGLDVRLGDFIIGKVQSASVNDGVVMGKILLEDGKIFESVLFQNNYFEKSSCI